MFLLCYNNYRNKKKRNKRTQKEREKKDMSNTVKNEKQNKTQFETMKAILINLDDTHKNEVRTETIKKALEMYTLKKCKNINYETERVAVNKESCANTTQNDKCFCFSVFSDDKTSAVRLTETWTNHKKMSWTLISKRVFDAMSDDFKNEYKEFIIENKKSQKYTFELTDIETIAFLDKFLTLKSAK